MSDIVIAKSNINMEALDAALRTALAEAVSGVSFRDGQVVVHMEDDATPTQVQQARQIVADHNPAALTPAQQAAADRQQALQQASQAAEAVTLNLGDYSGAAQQTLAKKVLWLERAVRDLQQRLGVE